MIMVFCFISLILSCHSAADGNISLPICPESFICPGLGALKYPFYNVTDRLCGLIKVNCTSKEIQFGGWVYEFVGKFDLDNDSNHNSDYIAIYNRTFQQLVKKKSCDALTYNFTPPSPSPLLYSVSIIPTITLFKCTKNLTYFEQHGYKSYNGCKDHNFYYNYLNGTVPSDLPHTCQVVHLPVQTPSSSDCQKIGLLCGTTEDRPYVRCLNVIKVKPGGEQTPITNTENKKSREWTRIKIWVITGSVFILMLSFIIFITWRHFFVVEKRKIRWRKNAKYNLKIEMFLENYEFLVPKRYSYGQVEMMTDSFKFKLGQGGFGTVYKGVLGNQNLVAVKVLSEVKGDGEDFINEVASVGRTSHVNIRFIYSRGSTRRSQLGWEKLHQIAIGIARGLEYLHRGCSTRILHFDIKPHNILLDDDFCPKISDFGMAKLFREKESKISVSHMRGTPGYIAPEIFSRSFGEISHKSDVYSYGMMILEMVGGRKNIEVGVDHTSEIYFPHWIYKKVELNEDQLGLTEIVTDEENRIAKKMIIVGLWCIQTSPFSRPTITRVLEMLEGELESLEIPPKPYLSSPPRSSSSI
ncbi:putative glycerophosphodiester phosphodiesterase, protein kinase RLK-Pelle-LRK10L-2 family [Helianthus debilis subsp. tardiflorus]